MRTALAILILAVGLALVAAGIGRLFGWLLVAAGLTVLTARAAAGPPRPRGRKWS